MRNAGTFFVIFSLFLTTWAMVAYPGSTYYNAEASRYSFWANTISELGMTQNYRHEPLVLSQWLFSGAVASFSVSVWLFLSQAARTSLQHILAAAPALCLFAIPFLPADHWQPAHNYVFFAAFSARYRLRGLCRRRPQPRFCRRSPRSSHIRQLSDCFPKSNRKSSYSNRSHFASKDCFLGCRPFHSLATKKGPVLSDLELTDPF